MSKIFITGSTDGLGQLAAENLIVEGHEVFLHARNQTRAKEALSKVKGAQKILVSDLSQIEEVIALATLVNEIGKMDAIIHNAGVYHSNAKTIFQVNVLAPYLLTSLIQKPKRLVYLSSGMHLGGNPTYKTDELDQLTYSDSKLMVTTLMQIVADKFPTTYSNAVDPGWVPTKMGGENATDDLDAGVVTQTWLASSDDPEAKVSGKYFKYQKVRRTHESVVHRDYQDKLIKLLEGISGIPL